jgi:hypothetical protein
MTKSRDAEAALELMEKDKATIFCSLKAFIVVESTYDQSILDKQ